MAITIDATKRWARPASAAEYTSLLLGSGIANPDSAWDGKEGSGNLADKIASLTLTAKGTPLYAQAGTGWAGTGVAADDNTSDGFTAGTGVGPSPATTSQVWMLIMAMETEPTAARTLMGMGGAVACTFVWNQSGATNRPRISINGVTATGTLDHGVGSYVLFLRYDRLASVAKIYTDLESVTGTYSSLVVDGNKGFGPASTTPGGHVIMGGALWSGANAETLDDAKIATIRTRIQNPPTALGHQYRNLIARY